MSDQIKKYFNLSIPNEELYSAGILEKGNHGVELIDGEYYASLYHIKNFIAQGELKNFLSRFNDTERLIEYARILIEQYKFEEVYVKYQNQSYEIRKYPYSAILNYFNEFKSKSDDQLMEELHRHDNIGLSQIKGKGYRRFQKLNPIEIGKINFFVGQNNAGKSTVVEMLRILVSFLKQTNHTYVDLNGVNYGRVINSTQKGENQNELELGGVFDDCSFFFRVHGMVNNSKPDVIHFLLDTPTLKVNFDLRNEEIQVVVEIKNDEIIVSETQSWEAVALLEENLKEINLLLNSEALSTLDKLDLNDKKNKLEKEFKLARNLVAHPLANSRPAKEVEVLFFEVSKEVIELRNPVTILNILKEMYHQNDASLKGKKLSADIFALRQKLDQKYDKFESHLMDVFNRINLTDIHYLQGASIKLATVLKSGDNHDALLSSIKYLEQEEVFETKNHITFEFIKKWLGYDEGFGLAKDIRVKSFENEVFTIQLLDDEWQHLGDIGLGAQHLFELIVSIARIVHYYQKHPTAFKPMLLVEEPESHIHPALQSKLADLFYQVNLEYELRFIIETHSEYIIRNTQLIGLNNQLFEPLKGNNPFNVVYFDKRNGPYTMEYNEDGRFERDFGEGFYDVSSKLLRAILKKSITRK